MRAPSISQAREVDGVGNRTDSKERALRSLQEVLTVLADPALGDTIQRVVRYHVASAAELLAAESETAAVCQ